MRQRIARLLYLSVVILVTSCASYYYSHLDFNKEFEQGDLRQALETLQKSDKLAHSKSRFLYYVNNGLLLSILGNYKESNEYFEKAYLFGEDYQKNYANIMASFLTNPNVIMYYGEDHEHLLVLYYKAINYLKMKKYEEALVECRRLNIRLQQLSDKYTSENKFRQDAFIHTLMGIIYQTTRDYNNAFIAYRNALEVYENDYARLFNLPPPEQLKKDLLNTAAWTGFAEEFEHYKSLFGMEDYVPAPPGTELVFFWHNGLGPVKDEWSINFAIHHEANNKVVFRNDRIGVDFPFSLDDDNDRRNLAKLEVFRVAFPRYVERPVYYEEAVLEAGGKCYVLEEVEDINKIAHHSLKERMLLEFSQGLLRVALKKATEHSLRKEHESLGAMLGMLNAMTEHADTRNWQTLPHSILYARLPLQKGSNKIHFSLKRGDSEDSHDFTYTANPGETLFHTFSSLETRGPGGGYY